MNFSSFYKFSTGFKCVCGDWLDQSSTFIFFLWNQLRVSIAVCSGSLFCWNIHPCLILIILLNSNRFFWEIFQYMTLFIFPSIIWIPLVPREEKQAHSMMFPLPSFTVGMTFRVIWRAKHGVVKFIYIYFLSYLSTLHSPSNLQLLQMFCSKNQTSFNIPFLQ